MSKEEKSTKYDGALYYLMTETVAYNDNKLIPLAKQALDDLQELVKRNEPMKVVKGGSTLGRYSPFCPNCDYELTFSEKEKYCPNCGQRLDWSDK